MQIKLIILPLLTSITQIIIASPTPIPANAITPNQPTYLVLSAAIYQPWSGDKTNVPEDFNFTVAGAWPGAAPVSCHTHWNANFLRQTDFKPDQSTQPMATVTAQKWDDPGVRWGLKRIMLEPWYGWDVEVTARYVHFDWWGVIWYC